jgi:hypothetical protein
MTSIEQFVAARVSIETLAKQIAQFLEHHAVQTSKKHLDEANKQLEVLKTMVSNDVQIVVATRLTAELTSLGTKVDKMASKMPVRKTAAKKKQEEAV